MPTPLQLSLDESTSEFVARRATQEGFQTTEAYVSDVLDRLRLREEIEQKVQDGLDSPCVDFTPELSQEVWDTAIARSRARAQNAR